VRDEKIEPIRVFLSYSSLDKEIAGQLKVALELQGIKAFLAHDDIEPTQEWEGVIIDNLKVCDVFIPLLSENFKESTWTDQETGIAVSEEKLIIPLKIDIDPYGFIGKIQALKINESISDTRDNILNIIKKSSVSDRLKNSLIIALVESKSFGSANANAIGLREYETFSKDQIDRIFRGFNKNAQVYGGYRSRTLVDKLFKTHGEIIDPEIKKRYEAKIART